MSEEPTQTRESLLVPVIRVGLGFAATFLIVIALNVWGERAYLIIERIVGTVAPNLPEMVALATCSVIAMFFGLAFALATYAVATLVARLFGLPLR
ncbi:MAG: hypothetical protein JWR84_541 [Caulobacter sp.]|nr:hypothetical protein [Caulobacter sp.]